MVTGVAGAGSNYRRQAPAPGTAGAPSTGTGGTLSTGTGGGPSPAGPDGRTAGATERDTVNALAGGAGAVASSSDGHRAGATPSRRGPRPDDRSATAAAIAGNSGRAASTAVEPSHGRTPGPTTGSGPAPSGVSAPEATLPDSGAVASALVSGASQSASHTTAGAGHPGCPADGTITGGSQC